MSAEGVLEWRGVDGLARQRVHLRPEVVDGERDDARLLHAAHRHRQPHRLQDAELPDLCDTPHVVVVLGEHDLLVEAAHLEVGRAAHENACPQRVR